MSTSISYPHMKIGRNDPCPCGSGKKYKKCCLDKTTQEVNFSKDYFSLKGKNAEKIVQELAIKTFLTDWCYLNPKLPDNKELSDLLVVFDDIAIIWQIKDLKLDKNGKYKKSEVDKNLRQLSGARRQLFDLKTTIELENPRRGKEKFSPGTIKEIYLISVLLGEGEKAFSFIEEIKNHTIHVFDKEFTQIILNELDTISDFTHYLKAKESLIRQNKKLIILGGEKELLAFYLMNKRSFERFDAATNILIDEGSWKLLQSKPEYKAKKEADRISYGWDSIINRAHMTSSQYEKLQYEKVARELARPNRFQRRYLSKVFFDAHIRAHNDNTHDLFRRIFPGEGTTYCFLFQDDAEARREKRKAMLSAMCWIARGKYQQNKKVLGIATEMKIRPMCSYDFCLLDIPNWTAENQKNMEQLQKETGIFANPKIGYAHEDEYPKIKHG
ncbi:MAG: SEC-C metal-binding domain-containing protein [Candidatus Omnitrophica bacterium]|nr:SEC-C metal-binding domain-containing protein [Candidatus Omnitrophota bacterium]